MTQNKSFDIAGILQEVYRFKLLNISTLSGYDDSNYIVQCAPVLIPGKQQKFIMKIINKVDTCKEGLTEAIVTVLKILPQMSFMIPRPQACVNGKLVCSLEEKPSGTFRNACLLTFVPGLDYKEISFQSASLTKLCHNIGICVGEMAFELFKIDNKQFPALQCVNAEYNIENLNLSRRKLTVVKDPDIRCICSDVMKVLEKFDSEKCKDGIREGIIHNDMCIENIIFKKNMKTTDDYSVAGIIDFSDMAISYCVFEVAIPIASAMYLTHFIDGSDMFTAGKSILSGFESEFPLTNPEKDFLFYSVLGRFVSLRVLGGYDVSQSAQTAEHEMHDTDTLDYFIGTMWSYGEQRWNKEMGI